MNLCFKYKNYADSQWMDGWSKILNFSWMFSKLIPNMWFVGVKLDKRWYKIVRWHQNLHIFCHFCECFKEFDKFLRHYSVEQTFRFLLGTYSTELISALIKLYNRWKVIVHCVNVLFSTHFKAQTTNFYMKIIFPPLLLPL